MDIMGEKGIGNLLKIVLQICFVGGIAFLVLLPIILILIGKHLNAFWIILYPNGVCFLVIVKQFIGLFNSLKENKPFSENTVKRLKVSGYASSVITIILGIETIMDILLVKDETLFALILGAICILFLGVSIALFILSELFKQATNYKSENDLTI